MLLYFFSPEALRADYPAACDLWAIGVTLFILLSGTLPFESEYDTKQGRYEFDEDEWGEVSEGAKGLIRELLVVDYKKRITAKQ
eukprot:8642755-Pyramimonas_sp.AAC.1